jgi:DnaJ-class molecular chaperone
MIMDKRCPYCKGQGTVPDPTGSAPRRPCPVCNRKGFNLVPRDANHCAYCHGNGTIPQEGGGMQMCPDCKGIGFTW